MSSSASPETNTIAPSPGNRDTRLKFASGVITEIFEAQAEATPTRIALVDGNQTLTYQRLNERSNQIAHYLRRHGVGAESMVGIFLGRNPDAISAIVGILKAGAAYVPIDPTYPADRVEYILKDAQVKLLITHSELAASVPDWGGNLIILEKEADALAKESTANPPTITSRDNAAYVIFTSGSTGRPKGVIVTHHNVTRLFSATDDYFKFSEKDVWTLFHSFTFDLSVWEMWGAFFYGGKLVVVPYLTSRSPQAFYQLLSEHGATSLTQTPSAFRQLIWTDEAAPKRLPLELRWVVLAGEALQLQSLRPWFELHGDETPAIINMYGITETTVHVTHRRITKQDLEAGRGSVIGEPMSDLTLHILDEQQKPCPVGVAGEIYVGGPGVARGYLNRPELNEKRFLPNPFCAGDRLYRSGDLARRLPDGEIEFLGRMDDQVKIRGFRVELGEVQSALNRHPHVKASVIIPQTQPDQSTRLIAYVVPKEKAPAVEELRSFLGETLPDYMIPAAFISIRAIPLTLNGKIDKRSLPAPDGSRPELATQLVLPESANEKMLAAIWQEILQINQVGVHDNFFALGGDSIRSIQVLAKAAERGLQFSLQTLFERPTIHELARAEAEAPEMMDETGRTPFSMVSRADREKLPASLADAYPMSKMQCGMVFHSGFAPRSAVFHDVFSYQVGFPFDETKFHLALERLIGRHAIFRTAFDLANYAEPLQLVYENVPVTFGVENLIGLSAPEQKTRLLDWIHTEKRRPFDWSKPPFTRFHVQLKSDSAFQLIVSFHHSVMDGWSLAAMVTELLQEYHSLCHPGAPAIKPLKLSYRDFVFLEQQSVQSAATRDFWKTQLDNAPFTPLPRWPAALRQGGQEQMRGPEIFVGAQVLNKLKGVAQSLGVPLKSVLLAAHCRVLAFLANQSEILTGLIANGRPQSEDGQRLIGVFLNTLPYRLSLPGGSWKDLIQSAFVQEKALLPHRRFPFSETKDSRGTKPAIEAAFDYVQFHAFLDVPGFKEGKFTEGDYFEANDFNLYTTFMLSADASELLAHFDYNPNELCEEQINLLCDYYVNTLGAIAENPDSRYERHVPLPEAELQRLLSEWNQTKTAFPSACVHRLFEEQASATPNRVAVEFGEEQLTYQELDLRANVLADQLKTLGVRSESIVAVAVERSVHMLIALLAVLKAGGAYLPLDPEYPRDRIAFMLDDSEAKVVLTNERLRSLFAGASAQIVAIDSSGRTASSATSNPPIETSSPAHNDPRSLAYLIYTSGSTGKPKGVQVPHSALSNFLQSMKRQLAISPEDKWLAVTTLSFDISGLELFLPLIVGARVVIAKSDSLLSGSELARDLERHDITILQATPVTWRALVESGWKGRRRLKALCGGEALSVELARQLMPLCAELWNLYGPTETTIWSTAHKFEADPDSVPIGRPIANTEVYILDHQQRPVATCAEGEIYIGGAGLARGYFKRPELTNERFVPHPYQPGQRLYRTGDLGRYLPDGTLAISGRVDHQIKIHGHRIELGEIEAVLQQHPGISAAVVSVRETSGQERRLVAYFVENSGPSVASSALRQHLEQKLPGYMVPSAFVRLPSFPLTPNGKLDRKRLPEPDEIETESELAHTAPRTPIEKMVAGLWKTVLRREQIGIDSDFFALGGDSLRAAQFIAKLRNEFDMPIAFDSIFKHRTLEAYASYLMDRLARKGAEQPKETAQSA